MKEGDIEGKYFDQHSSSICFLGGPHPSTQVGECRGRYAETSGGEKLGGPENGQKPIAAQ